MKVILEIDRELVDSSYDTLPELDCVISAASSGSRNTTPVCGLVLPCVVCFIVSISVITEIAYLYYLVHNMCSKYISR